jgi:RNA polymerase sigma-70 factor (ECF subfamily)
MNVIPTTVAVDLDRLLAELRPKLHRYCARMVGSAIDGEDVVQDALVKAVESFSCHRADRQSRRLAIPDCA